MKGIKISLISSQGEVVSEQTVGFPNLEGRKPLALVTQAVRAFLSNQRRALARAKTRAEVRGSGAKIWRQKGTGRARHGDRQAPIFVGGGVAHGPTGTQNYRQKLNRKMVQRATLSVLLEKIREKKLFLVKELNFRKTKDAFDYLEKIQNNLNIKGKIAFLLTKEEEEKRYLRNLKGVTVLSTESINPYFLLKSDFLLVSEAALKSLEKYFGIIREEDHAGKH